MNMRWGGSMRGTRRNAGRLVRLACVLWLSACAPAGSGPRGTPAAAGSDTLDFLTLNIWHDQRDWPARLDVMLDALEAVDADVICLQEVLQHEELPNQAETLARRLGYHVHFASWDPADSPRRYGNAVLTRTPILERGDRRLDPADDYRVVAHVRIAPGADTLDVYCTHLHHTQEGGEMRRTQILDALDFITRTRGGGPVLFAGDFNAPVTAPEMAPVLERFGDAYGALHAEAAEEVTTLNTALGHRFVRIDHVFHRSAPGVEIVPVEAEVVLDAPSPAGVWPSDHFGVLVRFVLRPGGAEAAPR